VAMTGDAAEFGVNEFEGRVVVVTSAARGMGRAYVTAFVERGAQVVGLDRSWSDVDPLPRAALAVTCELTSASDADAACSQVLDRFGTLDVLINNAAMRQRDLFPPHGSSTVLDATDADWQAMLDTNVVGVLRVTRHLVQPMKQQRRGSIINISTRGSVSTLLAAGVWGSAGGLGRNQPYDASKAALTNLSFALAEQLRPHNVAVNVVFPGGTRTTGSDEMCGRPSCARSGVGALLRPEHVVPLVLHLAQQDASGETGRAFDAVHWNADHGHGGRDAWLA
jgi:NAD(P)-dependent dehydrogenase (short-subunit alcohol dehydrogenase family)